MAAGIGGGLWAASRLLTRFPEPCEPLCPADLALPGTRYLMLDGHQVAYLDAGCGEPAVLFLPGFAKSIVSWQDVMVPLAATHRVICTDLLGFGASSRPPTLCAGDWLRQVAGLLDALGLTSVVLAGHSLGGRVALACATQMPERVRGLVLVSSDWEHTPREFPFVWGLGHSWLAEAALRRLQCDPGTIRRLLPLGYGPDFPITAPTVAHYVANLSVRGTDRALRALGRCHFRHELAWSPVAIRCPTLAIWGARDRLVPVGRAIALVERLPDAELIVLPQAGHVAQEEQPGAVVAHLRQFLARRT